MVAQIDLTSGSEMSWLRRDINDAALPQAGAFTPNGDVYFVAQLASNRVDAYDTFSGDLITSFSTGAAPLGLLVTENPPRLWGSKLFRPKCFTL